MTGKRVLITGATGFVGSHLARALVSAGAEVHAIRRASSTATRSGLEAVHWQDADVLDFSSLQRVVRAAKPSVVFHLAAYGTITPDRDVEKTYAVNVSGTWNLWRALEDQPCRFIYAGTCGEYGIKNGPVDETEACEPTTFYSATKHAAGTLVKALGRESGKEVVVLRLYGPYGDGDDPSRVIPNIISLLVRGEKVPVTAGEQVRDFAHVDDHVRAFMLAASGSLPQPVSTYNIGSGRCTELRQLFEVIVNEVGDQARSLLDVGALPYRDTEVWHVCADIAAARRDLGYEPRVSLEAGLARTVAWYRSVAAMT